MLHSGLDLVNDPTLDRYRNQTDVRDGGLQAIGPIGRMITAANVDGWVPWSERVPPAPLTVGL